MDGIIVINKPIGYTSYNIVYRVKKIFKEKVGHTGTLDPLATGVLPILIGKGTKLSNYLMEHDKEYIATLKLGKKTDTLDAEGEVIEEREVDDNIFNKDKIDEVLNKFIGKIEQIPPLYSAIKVNGKKLYEYARNGQNVEVKPRQVEIYKINLLNIDKEQKEIKFKVNCSKGTYIRTLCLDIAEKLGSIGYMSSLQRTRVGRFKIEDAITIDELEKNEQNNEFLNKNLISIEDIFIDKEVINLDDTKSFLNGVKIKIKKEDGIYRIYNNNNFMGTGIIENNLLKRDLVI